MPFPLEKIPFDLEKLSFALEKYCLLALEKIVFCFGKISSNFFGFPPQLIKHSCQLSKNRYGRLEISREVFRPKIRVFTGDIFFLKREPARIFFPVFKEKSHIFVTFYCCFYNWAPVFLKAFLKVSLKTSHFFKKPHIFVQKLEKGSNTGEIR